MKNEFPSTTDVRFRRSEIMQNIISSKPGFLIRWANLIFVVVFTLTGVIAWFIKYQDSFQTTSVLTSKTPALPIKIPRTGKIIELVVTEGQSVTNGQTLGYIQPTGTDQEVVRLVSPASGRVSLSPYAEKNQTVSVDLVIGLIYPEKTVYIVEVVIPADQVQKIHVGQHVFLTFDGYPRSEFGSVIGTIQSIDSGQESNTFRATVVLNSDDVTTLNRRIDYHNGLTTTVRIVTGDIRLLERFYYRIAGNK